MTEKQTSFVSVIVPVYNGGEKLRQCLDGIFENDYHPFEVIVVDDGSTDDSAALGRRAGARVLPTNKARSGPAHARNLGAAEAQGDILLFVDADVVIKPNTISRVANGFELDPDITALFGSYDDEPGETNFLSQYKNLQHHFVHQNSNPEASTFWAGLGAVRAHAFERLGGFDAERYAIPSIEDIEFGVRIRKAGHRVRLDKSIQGKHLKRWGIVSLLQTDIFCRAVPWSRLILTSQGMINDLNLKTADRACSLLVSMAMLVAALSLWTPWLLLMLVGILLSIWLLNLPIFQFFYKKRGLGFALLTFPLQLGYFFYSGAVFVLSWIRYRLLQNLMLGKKIDVSATDPRAGG